MIIAIDGPAGSGKTTVAKFLARELNILYLNTGAIYRALTLKTLQGNVCLDDEVRLIDLASNLDIKLDYEKVFLDGQDVTAEIHTPIIDKSISELASLRGVRESMVCLQRKIVKGHNAVVEGRDIATVVFPNAEYKFYLDASPKERAKRRYDELKEKGVKISLEDVENQMRIRDASDLNREIGPLKEDKDAIYVDTTDLDIDQVLGVILGYIRR